MKIINSMDENDKTIASLQKQVRAALRKVNALEQEIALLNYEAKKRKKQVIYTISNN